jgi:hypothetical protein
MGDLGHGRNGNSAAGSLPKRQKKKPAQQKHRSAKRKSPRSKNTEAPKEKARASSTG